MSYAEYFGYRPSGAYQADRGMGNEEDFMSAPFAGTDSPRTNPMQYVQMQDEQANRRREGTSLRDALIKSLMGSIGGGAQNPLAGSAPQGATTGGGLLPSLAKMGISALLGGGD